MTDKDIGTAAAVVFRATFAQEIRDKRYEPDAEERIAQYLAIFIKMIFRTCKTIMQQVYNEPNKPFLESVVLAAVKISTSERLVERQWIPVSPDDPVPPHLDEANENAEDDPTIRFDTYWASAKGPFVRLFGPVDMDAIKTVYHSVMTHAWLFRDALNKATQNDRVPIGRVQIARALTTPDDIMYTYIPINGLSANIKNEIRRKITKERDAHANPINNAFGFISNSNNDR